MPGLRFVGDHPGLRLHHRGGVRARVLGAAARWRRADEPHGRLRPLVYPLRALLHGGARRRERGPAAGRRGAVVPA